ncbi:NUDIX domain-containing protein [Agrobacterium rosae]|uniref:NUDIX domain-containing protein n=1 Tax=Agrobacterium rosae TaxID=1972867 RepID=UPI003BA06E84
MASYLTDLRSLVGNRLLLLPSVAAVIHDNAGNLLLQEKASGEGWSLPAGSIELGETPEQAITREVMEETGFIVSSTRILGVFGGQEFRYTYPNGHQVEYVVTLFKCQVHGSKGKWTDNETKSLRYFAENDMPSRPALLCFLSVFLMAQGN